MDPFLNFLRQIRIVPVVSIDDAGKAAPLAEALKAGGLPCIEFTFRTPAAAAAIEKAARVEGVRIGAGTVLTVGLARRALDAGAQFLVAPGLNPKLVEFCLACKVPVLPGVATPTEIETALSLGISLLKYFPAEAFGGTKTLKALAAPYPSVQFVPTGGIDMHNLKDYLALPFVAAVGGSFLAKAADIEEGRWAAISATAREARRIADG